MLTYSTKQWKGFQLSQRRGRQRQVWSEESALTPKLQLDLVIPKNVGRFQDGVEVSLLVPYIQALKIR